MNCLIYQEMRGHLHTIDFQQDAFVLSDGVCCGSLYVGQTRRESQIVSDMVGAKELV